MPEDDGNVTVFIALLRTEGAVTFCQAMGKFSDEADCKTNPAGDAGHEIIASFPLRTMESLAGEKSNASA